MSSIKKGDMLWCSLKHAQNNFGYGEVVNVWEEKDIGIVYEFFCQINGGLRMGKETNIIEKPNARMTAKLFEERKMVNEILKKKNW